ncbi:terpene synthase metal-binding domain-containing protein [Anabaenopsis circularis NIES-21]|uniref:Terpene synthase n=1 Tax=Anabaenopsis circularis NIES-21 TaxID=1085406 RepID=A0A1Z4GKX0_9CYAN|nr:terpene synthase metal-binding domain-containing protein [Anabaenopsis circularis NIES-21]
MEKLIFPDLYCPFPSQVNQYVDVLEDYAFEWVLRFNLLSNESTYQHFLKTNFFWLTANTYPHYQLEELKIGNDWLSWLFIWDDHCDLSDLRKQPQVLKVVHKRFLEIFTGAEEATSKDIPLTHALSDLRQRMIKMWGARYFHLLIPCLEDYFNGCVLQADNHSQKTIPDLETYIKTRRLSLAGDLVLAWIEYFNCLRIPNILRKHQIIEKINEMTINILAWCNDIFSFPKELASNDVHNLVLVLHYQQQLSLEQSVDYAVNMHNRELQALLELEKSLPSFGEELDTEIAKYLSGIHDWIRGNFDWCTKTARYNSVENLDLVKC